MRRKINSLLKKLDDDRASTKSLLSDKNNSEPQSNLSEITNDNASEQNTEVIQSNTQGNINTHVNNTDTQSQEGTSTQEGPNIQETQKLYAGSVTNQQATVQLQQNKVVS